MAVYAIKPIGSDVEPIYVKAKTKQQALSHVAKKNYSVYAMRVCCIIDLAVAGKPIEQAGLEETENVD